MGLDAARKTFFAESAEMLEEMERHLLELEDEPDNVESINALFRAVHTIKGSAGMFGYSSVSLFTHDVETLLDDVRQNKMTLTADISALLLRCHDHMKLLLDAAESGDETLAPEDALSGRNLTDNLKSIRGIADAPASQPAPVSPSAQSPADDAEFVMNRYWHISLRPSRDFYRHGFDPYTFIAYLRVKGEIREVRTIFSIPPHEHFDPESCYLGFEISFDAPAATKDEIFSVFEFIADDCSIHLLPPHSRIADYVKMIQELPEGSDRIGDILLETGALTRAELAEALSKQRAASVSPSGEVKKIGEIIAESGMAHQTVVNAAVEKQKIRATDDAKRRSIRVDADKLDTLINLVGELVISGASVRQKARDHAATELVDSVTLMARLIDDVRNNALNLRMVQIGESFSKFNRVVRDLGKELGKDIDLVVSGGETELDKTLIEKISDPLMHLVRNAVDHGITTPEDRVARGKKGQGTIRLNAYHETGSVVIEVADDGEGLKKDRIRAKAIERGLLREDQIIADRELFQLIFEPGFSTAERVTNVSGRGVGMDVVKRNIESLRGTVYIDSVEGRGTTVRIHLPLTLAIIDGFQVEITGRPYVIPLDLVIECVEVGRRELAAMEGGDFLNLRGDVLPFLRMREFFGEKPSEAAIENVVVVEYAGRKAGLVVDGLLGEFQTVIKPLGRIYRNLKWLSGATILGNGDISLILDVPQLISGIQKSEGNA